MKGTPDQYEVGDLSGKFDKLRTLHEYERNFNDTNLELIAPHSIIGRSIVIHKTDRNTRYACADLVRGYSPSEAAEYRAIASFHHPDGYAWGYVRFVSFQQPTQSVIINYSYSFTKCFITLFPL